MEIISKKYFKTRTASFSSFVFLLCFSPLMNPYSFADTYSVTYQYDGSSRLTGVIHSNGSTIQYAYDAAGNIVTEKVLLRAECPECAASPVDLTNVTFGPGTHCQCTDSSSITLRSGVTVENGANIIFRAPRVYVKPGAKFANGAAVEIKQQ